MCEKVEASGHQVVTKNRAKGEKMEQAQKTQIVAILRLAKGFS